VNIIELLKVNFSSISTQRKLEAAIANEDHETIKELISQSIHKILKAGLTKHQLKLLEVIDNEYKGDLNKLLSTAFQRGWVRDGSLNLSNAMDETLLEAQVIIKEYQDTVVN